MRGEVLKDSDVAEINANLRYLLDPYVDWTKRQNVPIVEGIAVDLHQIECAPWPRLGAGCKAAFVQLRGRGDFIGVHLIEIPPGGATAWQRHLYDEIFYVLKGHGSTIIDAGDGQQHSFEWGPRAVFSIPLNSPFRLFNVSGTEPVRIVSANDMPFLFNVFRNENFIFDNGFQFPERLGRKGYFAGEGDFLPIRPGKHMWETNFIPDMGALSLPEWEARGAGSRNIKLIMSDSSLHAHSSEMPVGSYRKAHRHVAGAHVFAVNGCGYTIMWYDGDKNFERYEWKHGFVFAPPDGMFHQHFNTGSQPARYLAVLLGSNRYPVLAKKVQHKLHPEASVKEGGLQIDYEDQDPRVHPMWLKEMDAAGVPSLMGKYFDEARIREQY